MKAPALVITPIRESQHGKFFTAATFEIIPNERHYFYAHFLMTSPESSRGTSLVQILSPSATNHSGDIETGHSK